MTVRQRAAIVYNPTKVDVARLRELVEAAEAELLWGPSIWAATSVDDPGSGATLRLLQASPDVVIAVGGDGTVSAVAQALRHQNVPLGIVPLGTTNLFARALDLPLGNPRRALLAAMSDDLRVVDVGRVDATLEGGEMVSHAFLVMTGMGVDAQMVANTSARGKSALGWVGYVRAILQSLTRNRQFMVSYALDGAAALPAGPAHTLVIGNAGVLPAGIRMIPGALIDDGELDVVLLRPRGWRGWNEAVTWFVRTNTPYVPRPPRAYAAAIGAEPVDAEFVSHTRAAAISATLETAEDFEIDGEYVGRATALEAWIEKGALRVRGSVADPRRAALRSGEISSRGQHLAESLVATWRRLVSPLRA